MGKLFILAIAVSAPLWAADETLKSERVTLGKDYNVFSKVVDVEEDRVCYSTISGASGGVAMQCFDRKKEAKPKPHAQLSGVAEDGE